MEPFEFDNSLSVGNAHIDSQHRDLMRRFGRLGAGRPAGFPPERMLKSMMSDLLIAATRHFIDEEELMKHSGYPDCERHTREHAAFVEHLSQMQCMDKDEILRTSMPSLAEEMIQHMKTQDMAYRPYLVADS